MNFSNAQREIPSGLTHLLRSVLRRHALALAGYLALVAATANAAPSETQRQGSPEFERMKKLVGTWKGKANMGLGEQEMRVEYRLIAGGSALEERIFAGTEKEMVTMYYDKNGKLALTHYCMLANQPSMLLKSSNAKSLNFDFDPACGLDPQTTMHMHALSITFENPDTITESWKLFDKGEAKASHPFTLTRVKT